MSGVTSLVDTLLATRLAQRLDLLPLKSQVEITGPGAVAGVEKITNDVRLPSRAALEQGLGVGLSAGGSGDDGPGSHASGSGGVVTLSTVARAIGALLGPEPGVTLKIRSAEPLWSLSRPPSGHLLTARLADTVTGSGLFYESHLQQFAAGVRPLALLAREPQAGLTSFFQPAPPAADGGSAPAAGPGTGLAGKPLASGGASPAVLPGPVGPEAPGQAVHLAAVYDRDGSTGSLATRFHEIAGQVPDDATTPAAGGPDNKAPVAASIHPDALVLVRQQLELLAEPVFRWCGEAWPGASMSWEIQQEQSEKPADGDAGDDAPEPAWTTHLAMTLPTLKSVDVRVTLAGNTLQLRLGASGEAALAALTGGRDALSGRLQALGLQLTGLRIGAISGVDASGTGN